ncbi:MAG: hypothetical protein ACXVFQ_18735 [Solirubrobacteraceae bacterium]
MRLGVRRDTGPLRPKRRRHEHKPDGTGDPQPAVRRFYARVLEPLSKRDRNRERLLADLDGRVLELGCGAGINFPSTRAPFRT